MGLLETVPDVIKSYPGDDLMLSGANHRRGLLRRSLRSNGRLFLKIRAIGRTPPCYGLDRLSLLSAPHEPAADGTSQLQAIADCEFLPPI